ncbi:MAG TPA: serine hydrolase [Arsenicitalea sp.]|nr:serine hydrolase [Arsenicitalea sp.]
MTKASKLERATPESQGVDSAAIAALVERGNEHAFHSLMVLRHGKVIAEGWWAPYTADEPHMMFSVSKSVTATAIGMLVAEGRASLDEEMLSVFPNLASDAAKANARGVKVRHVLAMATGHAVDTMEIMRALPHEDWVSIFFGVPVDYPPGTHFLYNSGASYVLAAMITARTGQSVRDYLESRLFQPLGIVDAPWEKNPRGINFGASGLRLRTEDLAKFGQLYLNRGMWEGKRLLTEEWVAEATAKHVSNGTDPKSDWAQGYGFQIWRSLHNSYRMDGRYGQFSLVLPEQDMVIAITAGVKNNRAVTDMLWETLLPGVHAKALPENPSAEAKLRASLSAQAVALPAFLASDPKLAAQVHGRKIALPFNLMGASAVELSFSADAIDLRVERRDGGTETLPAGRKRWASGVTHMWPHEEMKQAKLESRAGWIDERTLEIRQQCVETPFSRNWRFAFDGADRVTVSVGLDNGFWVERTEVLAGVLS